MKTSEKLVAVTGLLALLLGVTPTAADPQKIIDDAAARAYLFTMSGTSGSFADDRLTLDGVPLVVYFTDRPHREAGHMSLEDFLKMWRGGGDSFDKDPPNAELAVYAAGSDTNSVVILDEPKIGEGSISFRVATLGKGAIPATFSHATLFIDAFPCAVNGCIMP